MNFKKWYSIENHYQEVTIQKWANRFPELNNMLFEVTEKIHGANFSIIVETNGTVKYASRNGILKDSDKFYGYKEVFSREEYIYLINELKKIAKRLNNDIQLYGELFGGKIQKGVFYGDEKNFKWYALRVKEDIIRPNIVNYFLRDLMEYKVPLIGVFNSNGSVLEMVRSIDVNIRSALTPQDYKDDNIIEGVVIVPFDIMVRNQDSYFMIKKKTKEFKDKSSKPKRDRKEKKTIILDESVQNMLDEAELYINENRTNDLQSKMGKFEEIKDISKFAKAYFNDMFIDFEKDNYTDWHNLDKISQGIIKKTIGSKIFQELKLSLTR